jgi:hypothetical protein
MLELVAQTYVNLFLVGICARFLKISTEINLASKSELLILKTVSQDTSVLEPDPYVFGPPTSLFVIICTDQDRLSVQGSGFVPKCHGFGTLQDTVKSTHSYLVLYRYLLKHF